jgi:hydroxymethylglutaryl-CoA lyase
MRERVYLREVGLRDGLQLVRDALPTAQKLQWIQEEFAAGVNLCRRGDTSTPNKSSDLVTTEIRTAPIGIFCSLL